MTEYNKSKSIVFVIIQFSCIAYFIILPGELSIFSYLIAGIGFTVGLSAIISMRKSKLNIMPDVLDGAKLVSSGVYKYIRHPMYTSVLLLCLGLLLKNIGPLSTTIYLLLFADLWFKLKYEEKLLSKTFVNYKKYTIKTKRLIPWIV